MSEISIAMARQKILIIEDESSIADTIVYALESEGFDVLWKAHGKEGLEALEERDFDLIVLDIGLPDINGFELCKRIRAQSNTPIIFLTARGEEIDRIVGLEIGGDDYITKPFSPRELAVRVKTVLRRAAVNQPADRERQSLDNLHIDTDKRAVTYFGEELVLTRYEFDLLKVLATTPGRVYSREQLMQLVWVDNYASMERTVDAHIKSLRAKMKAIESGSDPIITHRGVGYSLSEAL